MKLHLTDTFSKGYKKLPNDIQKQVDKKLALFIEQGQVYPSLRCKAFQKYKDEWIYELSVTKNYRIILQKINSEEYYLLKVGPHDVLENFNL